MKYTAKGGQIYEQVWMPDGVVAKKLNELTADLNAAHAYVEELQEECQKANARIADLERNGSHDQLRATQALVDELRAELESSQTPDPPAELEDALAKIIRDAWNTDFTWSTTARAAIAFLRPFTWRDVEAKWDELHGRGYTSVSADYSALLAWLRANLPGGEG